MIAVSLFRCLWVIKFFIMSSCMLVFSQNKSVLSSRYYSKPCKLKARRERPTTMPNKIMKSMLSSKL